MRSGPARSEAAFRLDAFSSGADVLITKLLEFEQHHVNQTERCDPDDRAKHLETGRAEGRQIIKIAQAGVHDAAQLSALALAELRIR